MWDPASNVKFANNEPARPFFRNSQINIFNEELRGDGVQHVALTVGDIVGAVRSLRGRGVSFMPTPGSYYDMLPERIAKSGIGAIDEDWPPCASSRSWSTATTTTPTCCRSSSRSRRPVRRPQGRAVLLRDHPAQGRSRLRRRQLPRAVREHRARADQGAKPQGA
jgi:hypothetical protein